MSKRVVITGMGTVNPIGNSVSEYWTSLKSGKSGIGAITSFDASDYPTRIAGHVNNLDFSRYVDPKEVNRTDRYILLALAATDEAVNQAGLSQNSSVDPERCGIIVASGIGGIRTFEDETEKLLTRGPKRVSPFLVPMMITDMAAGMISIKYGFKGPNYAVVSACASAAHAIGDAMMAIKAGMMDVAIAGGAEAAISRMGISGFCAMKALSTNNDNPEKASRPFELNRDGFVMGEGAGIVILESLEHAQARGARIIAEMTGFGATGDAHHLSAPAPDHEGAQRAMKMAMRIAGVTPREIDYINAHGTSTKYNDEHESKAIRLVFGEYADSVSISSTKSMTGHLLGASGGIELIASVLAMVNDCIPPTINYDEPDPECTLNYTPNKAVEKKIDCIMSNSFGFGGHNAVLISKKYESSEANG
jgi:3-oxoacyl-[acyl-carrier-protein] synthase II